MLNQLIILYGERLPQPYSRGRVWAKPIKGNILDALIIMRKNPDEMYKQPGSGYTINRKNTRHHKIHRVDSKILHIELLSEKLKFP